MLNKFTFTVAALVVLAAFVIAGCGSDDQSANPGIANEIVDSVATTVARNLQEAELAKAQPMGTAVDESVKMITEIADVDYDVIIGIALK